MHTEQYAFNAFMPIDINKSVDSNTATDNSTCTVKGWASTPSVDLQNEVVDPKGINIDYFLNNGYINYEHQKEKVIGYPTENCYVDVEKGLFLEAKVFKNNEDAKKLLDLAENLEKSGSNRKIGFSIEGQIKKRNVNDDRIIEEVMITAVALCKSPANPEATVDSILKSFTTGTGITPESQDSAGALRRESLSSAVSNLSYTVSIKDSSKLKELWDGVVEDLNKSGSMGYEESVITLQLARGLSRNDAEKAVINLISNTLE